MSEVKKLEESQSKRKGLIVSISNYDDKDLQQLEFCKNDGEKMYEVLKSLGYEIPEHFKLIGRVNYVDMRSAIMKFFKDKNTKPKDTLLFYFSGHGVPDGSGDTYLSTSEIDSGDPDENGLSFDELTKMMGKSISKKIVTILDCCYSGRARVAKGGNDKTVAKVAKEVMEETFEKKRSNYNLGQGKCLMASSLAHQESVMLKKLGHSLFTYYLLAGLSGGGGQSVDEEGCVTPSLLGDYIDDQIMSLPLDKRPDQRPIIKTEISGKFILAEHPKLVKRHPTWESANATSEAFFSKINRGDRYAKNKDYASAIRCYEEAIAIDPNNPNKRLSYIGKGDVFYEMGKNEEAIKAYKEAIAIAPKDPEAYDLLGDVYFRLKDYKQALKSYDQALDIEPESSEYLKDKGLALYELKDYEKASYWFDKAIAANPNNAKAQKYKGEVLLRLQKYEEAINSFQRALSIDPTFIEAKENLEFAKSQVSQSYQVKKQSEESKEEKYGTRRAIVIGINRYQSDSEIPVLDGAENDAVEVCNRLQNNGNFEVSNDHLLLGANATRQKILKAVGDIFKGKEVCDLFVFYFSGHGMIGENNVGYLAPYDMDPEDPFLNGISMEDLRNFISKSKNKASAIMLLDCCYAGIGIKGSKSVIGTILPHLRNSYAEQLQKIVESPSVQNMENVGRGKVILASSEGTAVSKERNNCTHSGKEDPHTHGAFSFHLIEGLEGRAADPRTGVVTIDNLRRHIELELKRETRQRPMYWYSGGADLDLESIIITKSLEKFNAKILEIIEEVQRFSSVKYQNSDLVDIQCLANAAKKVGELISLDPKNPEIEKLSTVIDTAAKALFPPAINWININQGVARHIINEIEPGLYPGKLKSLVQQSASLESLQKIDQNTLNILIYLFDEVSNNTIFESEEDERLTYFRESLRASIKPG